MADTTDTAPPTAADITADVKDNHISLVQRRIGRRYLIVHLSPRAFVLGIGVEACRFGLIWFIGPLSFCIARPL